MRHLFIINPTLIKTKDRVRSIQAEIAGFFESYPDIKYDIHVTRWSRDASVYTRRYVAGADELVRVHVLGGSGTLLEVVNGVIGLPNAQVASHPLGVCNDFLRYFGADKMSLFASLRGQVFSDTISIDAFCYGSEHALSYCMVGMEAKAAALGDEMIARTHLPDDFCYLTTAVSKMIFDKDLSQNYSVTLDGQKLDGEYVTILMANQPCYGENMYPAVDAHPNDGLIDLYLFKRASRLKVIAAVGAYTSGNYKKVPDVISHYTGRNVEISSGSVIYASADGETFNETSINVAIVPNAVDFVCPDGIDITKLPKIYNKPDSEEPNA